MSALFAPGDFVKASREGQRLWWIVSEVRDGCVVGHLDNVPAEALDGFPLPVRPSFKIGNGEVIALDEIIDHIARP